MRFRLIRAALTALFFIMLTLSTSHAVILLEQDESEMTAGAAPAEKTVTRGNMESVREERKKIIEEEKAKPKREMATFPEKKKPFIIRDSVRDSQPADAEKKPESEKNRGRATKKIFINTILSLFALLLGTYLFYRFTLKRFGMDKDSQE